MRFHTALVGRSIAALLMLSIESGFCQNMQEIDSLKRLLTETDNDSLKIVLNDGLLDSYVLADFDSAFKYARAGLDIAARNDNQKQLAQALNSLGLVHDYSGAMDSAHHYYNQALEIRLEIGDSVLIANSLSNLGVSYYFMGDYESALEYYLKALVVRERINDLKGRGQSYNNVGVIYREQENLEKANDYFKLSIQVKKLAGDDQGVMYTLMNIANNNYELGKLDSARIYLEEALFLGRKLQEKMSIAECLSSLGDIHLTSAERSTALQYYKEAMESFEELGDTRNLAANLLKISSYRQDEGLIDQAIADATKALSYAGETGIVDQQKQAHQLLSTAFAKKENYKEAYYHEQRFKILSDSLLNESNSRSIAEMNVKYETEKKEQEIELLNATNELNMLRIENSSRERNFFIAIALFVLAALVILVINYRQKQAANLSLKKAIAEKETLLKEIHHRVKNNLQVISSLLNLQSKHLDDQTALDAVKEGQNRVKSMALIHQKLYQENNLTGITIHDYILNLTDSLYSSYGVDKEKVVLDLDVEELNLDVDTTIPLGLIINELITNTLKYAFPDDQTGSLNISLKRIDERLELSVKDDGVGIPQNLDIGKAKSFGLKLVHALAEKLKASVDIRNEQGTAVQLDIHSFKLA